MMTHWLILAQQNPAADSLVMVLIGGFLVVLGIMIFVAILRWALRINDIVRELETIRRTLEKRPEA